jgi:hypothetical protein
MLQAGRSRVRVPMWWIFFFNWPNPSSRTMALGSTQPLTEMSIRNLPCWQPYRHLWADCLEKMWEPRRLTTLWASTACYRDSFTFLPIARNLKPFFACCRRWKVTYCSPQEAEIPKFGERLALNISRYRMTGKIRSRTSIAVNRAHIKNTPMLYRYRKIQPKTYLA